MLNKIEKFTAKKQWILLEDYARDLHGRYELKYYWIAEAQFHKQNYDSAIINYQRVLSFDSVPAKVKGSAKERLLQISYSRNNFSKEMVKMRVFKIKNKIKNSEEIANYF